MPSEQEGAVVSSEERFYLDWGRESLKNNIATANDVLKQLVTLNTALLGVSILFLNAKMTLAFFAWIATLFFILSLIVAFSGVMPYRAELDLNSPSDIRVHKKKALTIKMRYLYGAAMLAIGGFLSAIMGIGLKKFC